MSATSSSLPVIVAGGGIGGLAAALALVRQGFQVTVLEQAPEIGEIGAGIQLGPNAFHAFDALGVGDKARGRAVYTDYMVMHDALDESQVGKIETGEAFRKRFGNPYAVIHRVDVHLSLLEGAQETGKVEFHTNTRIVSVEQDEAAKTVTAIDQNGKRWTGQALIGADGGKSVVRQQYVNDPPRVTGHVVYRAVVDKKDFPENLQWNAASLWAGPKCHLVHYPLRGGEQYNVVVTFHSRQQEEWGVTDGSKEEVESYFQGICPKARQLIELPKSWKRWATADREPIGNWVFGRATIHRADLHGLLLEAVQRHSGVRVHLGARLAAYEVTAHSVHVTCADDSVFQGAALIGADGLWSRVRTQLLGAHPGKVTTTLYCSPPRSG